MKTVAAVLILLLCAAPAWAAIYRWTDAQGNIHFSDKPHPGARKVEHLPQLDTYSAPPQALSRGASGQSSAAKIAHDRYRTLRVVAPQPKQTFRSAQRTIRVSVRSQPSLQARRGDRFVYYLDGHKIAGPTAANSVVLHGINRGTHNISAAVVNAKGRELVRAVPVTVYMKPPIVKRNNPAFGG